MSRSYAVLIARIRAELDDLDRARARIEKSVPLARIAGDSQDVYLDSIALNLHDIYSGYERAFKLIAETVDRDVPEGSGWHRSLLEQMAVGVSELRPAVISRTTADSLAEYLGFRHVVRNVYSFRFDPLRLDLLASRLPAVMAACQTDLDRFCSFLEALDAPTSPA